MGDAGGRWRDKQNYLRLKRDKGVLNSIRRVRKSRRLNNAYDESVSPTSKWNTIREFQLKIRS